MINSKRLRLLIVVVGLAAMVLAAVGTFGASLRIPYLFATLMVVDRPAIQLAEWVADLFFGRARLAPSYLESVITNILVITFTGVQWGGIAAIFSIALDRFLPSSYRPGTE